MAGNNNSFVYAIITRQRKKKLQESEKNFLFARTVKDMQQKVELQIFLHGMLTDSFPSIHHILYGGKIF